jgi:prepilin-type N-terminal cleavage/methylation domain-containing protein
MRRNAGLTLIELIAALTIAAMLMTAVLGVVTTLSRGQAAQKGQCEAVSLRLRLQSLMAPDFRSARQCRSTDQGLELTCGAGLDPETLELRHLDSTVTYKVVRLGAESCLVREQNSEVLGGFSELVCRGVTSIQSEALAADVVADNAPKRPGPRASRDRNPPKPAPQAMRVVVEFESREPIEVVLYRSW